MPTTVSRLLEPFTFKRKLPKNYSESDREYFERELYRECNGVNAADCENVVLDVHKGVIIDKWTVRPESLVSPALLPTYGLPYVLRTKLKPRKAIDAGPYLIVHTSYCEGYGHWMSDAIPRLFISRNHLHTHTLVLPDNYKHNFYIDSLAPFGITQKSQIKYLQDSRVHLRRLFCPAHVGPSFCNVKDEILQEIRNLYYDYFRLPQSNPSRRIYVSRAKVKRRFVRNELEVIDVLRKYGFEIVHFQDLSFYEQVKLSSETEIMIGLTGSGLNNMMFMPENSKVLEFKMRNDFQNLHYFGFASGLNLHYYYLICDTVGKIRFEADFHIDTNHLEDIVSTITK